MNSLGLQLSTFSLIERCSEILYWNHERW